MLDNFFQLNRFPPGKAFWIKLGFSFSFFGLGFVANSPGLTENQYQRFSEWCNNKSSISTEAKHTVNALLELAKTQNCQQAEENLSQIVVLELWGREITDLRPLSSLTHLLGLNLSDNNITDIRPLATLSNLKMLLLTDNQISDITPLNSLNNLSSVNLWKNNIERLPALAHLNQIHSLDLRENPISQKKCPVRPATVCIFRNEGQELFSQAEQQYKTGDFKSALENFQTVLVTYEKSGDRLKQADTLNRIADIHTILGQYSQALQLYQKTLQVREELGDLPGVGISLTSQANIYERLGQYQKAVTVLEKALENLKQQYNSPIPMEGGVWELPKDEGILRNRLAVVQNKLGKHEDALLSAQESLDRFQLLPNGYNGKRYGERMAFDTMGVTYWQMGRHGLALQSLEKALAIAQEIDDKAGVGTTLNHIGDVHFSLGETQKALSAYQDALAIRRSVGDQAGVGMTLHRIGYTLLQAEQFPEASQTLFAAIEVWESLRPGLTDENKVSLFEVQAATYGYLQEALIAQQKIEQALTIAERGRARAFVELLASRLQGKSSEQFQSPEPPSVEKIRQIAQQQNATIVEYSIVGKNLYIWVIQPNGVINLRSVDLTKLNISLGEAAELSRVAAEQGLNRGGVQNPTLNSFLRGMRETVENQRTVEEDAAPKRFRNRRFWKTYQLLIEPIADLLPTDPTSHVIFIPQGPLFSVPFPALQDKEGNYLIEKHTIMTAPAIQVLDLAEQQRNRIQQQNNQNVLVVGNPTMPTLPNLKLDPLPGAETEAIAIAKMLNTQAIVGEDATESVIIEQMKSARIVHLATHGLLQEVKQLQLNIPGAMVFASSRQDDGLLTSQEIIDLQLNAELVVLSACNTGLGNITGDGVIGLSRSFISAGVSSVIVSLWKVPDQPTSELMQIFYREMQQNPDKATALRQAMLETLQKYPQPSDWAAFTLIGEAEQS